MRRNQKGSVTLRTIFLLLANAGMLVWVFSSYQNAKNERPAVSVPYQATAAPSTGSAEDGPLLVMEDPEEFEAESGDVITAVTGGTITERPGIEPDETLNFQMFDWYENGVRQNWFPEEAAQITDVTEILGDWKGYVKYDPDNTTGEAGYLLTRLNIDPGQDGLAATCSWYYSHYLRDEEGSYEDSQSHFYGSFEDGQLYAEGPGILHLKYFCALNGTQYGVGMMETRDGVKAVICLMRP